ncbi:hypothetical protein [Zunongwangia atlantica]|uniref:Uncharacterized protein n=1 Tax=Zunongwangia atlantica 22II14-10F7 TaxID=1185767 RepID=A0A1Y1SYI8_9FLAO|nr:hypothetical protein [Zunongwangia atlantica]ORL43810.1 hypothetical protein IIF7_19199 [Zunongwangia atlantica 22II14-10F7]
MKKLICVSLLSIAFVALANGQAIFKGLEYGMSPESAKKEFRANKDDYKSVDLGNGFLYRIYQQNFQFKDEKLVKVLMTPKGAALGQNYDSAKSYLEYSRAFFEDLNYEVFFEPEYWNGPQNFGSKYGLLLMNPDKTTMVQMYPVKLQGNTFIVNLEIYNYDQFMEWYKAEDDRMTEKAENSGF